MATSASIPNMSAKEQYQALLAQMAVIQAQAECEERKERERVEREEWEHAEWEEHERIEAARVAAEREGARKAQRAAKRAGKQKATEEAMEEAEVVVVDGPSEEVRLKKKSKDCRVPCGA